ncbi:VWA domain-containing protein [Streptomyces sp. NPDC057654]|uniref:VWA domain-containing protein n=1 Tax=Streptomyces sp. NPDC057654 TaxID=3346196 RepID=UPI0036AC6C2E
MSEITVRVHQNKYLPAAAGRGEMHAIVTVAARGLGPAAAHTDASEVIVIDCSSSMSWPPTKIAAARRATAAAVQLLRDGTRFAIVEGTEQARVAFPAGGELAVAGPDSKEQAVRAAYRLDAIGGTAIASWLERAGELHAAHRVPIRHTLLLTDGKNEHDPPGRLEQVLTDCAERFICDARGIGEDWDQAELRRIAADLHGRADAVRDDSDLEAEFRTLVRSAMAKSLAEVRLVIKHRAGSELRFVRQVHPTRADLTGQREYTDGRTWSYRAAAWGDEVREYHVCLAADPDGDPVDQDVELASVELELTGDAAPPAPEAASVLVHWTKDPPPFLSVDPSLAHYDAQAELAEAVAEGCAAYDRGDRETARRQWGRAAKLAHATGDRRVLARLGRLVRITDATAGVVEVRDDFQAIDINSILVINDESLRAPDPDEGPQDLPAQSPPDITCTRCKRVNPGDTGYCEQCDSPLRAEPPS